MNGTWRFLAPVFLLICVGVALIPMVAAVAANDDWHGTSARISDGSATSVIRLWERGPDVVLAFEVANRVTDQTRCENGVLTDFDMTHNTQVIHADMSASDCTRIASDPLRGAYRQVHDGSYKASPAVGGQGRTEYTPDRQGLPTIVLDDSTGLPVSVASRAHTVYFIYVPIDAPGPPPAPAGDSSTYVEEYQSATTSVVASAFKATGLPAQLGDFALDKAFTYDAGKRARLLRHLARQVGPSDSGCVEYAGSRQRSSFWLLQRRWPVHVPRARGQY
jgi:hypothetical protein